ncbi:MAG: riboflavin biosynthesis protein RibF [Candidatus Margulisiibacteriota bacterium]
MKIIRHPQKSRLHRPVVALGTFDGVHLGHRKVILAAVKYAQKIGAHSAVITFDPHPQEIVAPERGLRLLTTLGEREEFFCSLGVDSVIVIRFTPTMRALSYKKFIQRYLVKKLGVRGVFVGYDHAFGHDRSAGTKELRQLGRELGFSVTVVPAVKVGHRLPKSGLIRELVSRGRFSQAVKLLGHPYRLTGRVVGGYGRGRKLGFPTANLKVDPRKLLPAQGVYTGTVNDRQCLVNIGFRPTFGHGDQLVEVHLLGFRGNLRGKTLKVDLWHRLRDEKKFIDAAALVGQIKKDIAQARRL